MTGHVIAVSAAVIAIAAVAASLIIYIRTSGILGRIDRMLDQAISGEFSETDFSEERMSRLETKTHRYLAKGRTAQKQIEAERAAVKTIVSDISHQTKTPIANMLLYTELLKENVSLDDEGRELVSRIEEQTGKLSFLISSLVKTSRLESGIISLVPSENSVQELLEELYAVFRPQAESCGRNLELDLRDNGESELTAVFDRRWTMEALSNIVDNALKYTEKNGTVTISAVQYPMFARVDITDDGIGISEEESSRVFGRFYRSQQAADKPGVGIGLYLAREIISREGGYIRLDSELGQGATFSVFLPAG